jgi:hypothetical protein
MNSRPPASVRAGLAAIELVRGMMTLGAPTNSLKRGPRTAIIHTLVWVMLTLSSAAFAAAPAFSVHKNGTDQTISSATNTLLTWSTETFDTNNNFASNRFTPTIAGKYLIVVSARCAQPGMCIPSIYKNGTLYAQTQWTNHNFADQAPQATAIIDMNGSSDYVEAYVYSTGTVVGGTSDRTYFSGSQIDGGGSGSITPAGNDGSIQFKSDGNLGADALQLHWDSANKHLGIGTSTPSTKLQVKGALGSVHLGDTQEGFGAGTNNSGAIYFGPAPSPVTNTTAGIEASWGGVTTPQIHIGTLRQAAPTFMSAYYTGVLTFSTIGVERMRITSNGNVGIGTTSPATLLHVSGGSEQLRLAPSAGSSTAIAMYDGGGNAAARGWGWRTNDTTWGNLRLYESASSTGDPFAGAARMTILSGGNVGIGTPSPAATLDVAGRIFASTDGTKLARVTFATNVSAPTTSPVWNIDGTGGIMRFFREPDLSTAGTVYMVLDDTGNLGVGVGVPSYRIDLPNTASAAGRGRANSWTTYSDGRYKTDIESIDSALDKVMALKGVTYTSTTEVNGARQVGFIAQEVEKVVPEVVSVSKTTVTRPDGSTEVVDDYRSLAYDRLVPVLTEAVKELKAANDNLRADNDDLRAELHDTTNSQNAQIEALRRKIEALESTR